MLTELEKIELRVHREVYNLTARKIEETPWWKFKEQYRLRNTLRRAYYHIKKLNNNKNLIP